MFRLHRPRKTVEPTLIQLLSSVLIAVTVDWAELEALDISQLDQPGGKEALAAQVLRFINKKGRCHPSQSVKIGC